MEESVITVPLFQIIDVCRYILPLLGKPGKNLLYVFDLFFNKNLVSKFVPRGMQYNNYYTKT